MKKILISLIIFNQVLLFIYFVYHLNDRDLDLSQMRQSLFQINHQELYTNQDEQELSDQQEFSEEEDELINQDQQQNLDILYKDVDETLDFIGDDNMDQKQQFINEALNSIDITPNIQIKQQSIRSQHQLKLLKDPHYCNLNNMYYFTHKPIPLTIITDFDVQSPVSKVIDEIGKDVLPAIPLYSNKLYNIPLNTSMYFMENLNFYKYFKIGMEAICFYQSINIIPGSEILFQDYHKLQLNIPKIENYAMKDEEQCKFVMQINETEIENYLMKFKKRQTLNLDKLKKKYHNGLMCGKIMDNIIIQKKIKIEQQYNNIVLLSQPNKYKYFNNQTYDSTINNQLNNLSFVILNESQQYMEQDQRFFQLFYFTFIQNSGQLYFNSITSNLNKMGNSQYIQQIVKETILFQNSLQNDLQLKF